jgi:D-tyrosyl-tRNA(Tyr) deacylase
LLQDIRNRIPPKIAVPYIVFLRRQHWKNKAFPGIIRMIALLQRVTQASVTVDGREIARIGLGLLVLIGIEREDTPDDAARLAERIAGYRVFSDTDGKMNQSVTDAQGEVLLVPQFTLAADTRKGMRPGFQTAAEPAKGRLLFDELVGRLRASGLAVGVGLFGADMKVSLINDGPVTFRLETRHSAK